MLQTRKMMLEIAIKERLTLEEIAIRYKKVENPALLAKAFLNLFGFISEKSKTFSLLAEEDIASISLQKLHESLLLFEAERNFKFITYFGNVLHNEFRTEMQKITTQKRKTIYNTTPIMETDSFDDNCLVDSEFKEVLDNIDLTEMENKYCKLLASNWGSNKDIAKLLGVSVMTLCNMRKRIKEKLEFAL